MMTKLYSFLTLAAVAVFTSSAYAVNDNPPPLVQGPVLSAEDLAKVNQLNAELITLAEIKKEAEVKKADIEKQIHFVARIAEKDGIDVSVKPDLKSLYLYLTNNDEYAIAKSEVDLMSPDQVQARVDLLLSLRNDIASELSQIAKEMHDIRGEIQNIYAKYMKEFDLNSL